MALHTELPIYKLAYDLLGLAADLIKNMPRDFKQSFGGEIRNECIRLLLLIGRANASADKLPHLAELIERLHVTELLLRLSRDKRFISIPQYAKAIELTSRIGRQAGGWRKHFAASPVA
jgi:hypothetical protein